MTPTRSQLDAALPRVPSGIGAMAGDLTDDDDRAVALDWLVKLYVRAVYPELERRQRELNAEVQEVTAKFLDDHGWTQEQIDGVRTTIEWLRSLRQGDRMHWPPPTKGTHESDLDVIEGPPLGDDPQSSPGGWDEYDRAVIYWSDDHPPAPGITYHDAEEAL